VKAAREAVGPDVAIMLDVNCPWTVAQAIEMERAALAEAHSIEFIPHRAYFGPGNLASIHIVASLATDTLLESIYANLEASPFGDAMLARDGKVRVPSGPGLGIEPDMAVVAKYRQGAVGVVR
jgi:D-galactarolactone cycloisomerase